MLRGKIAKRPKEVRKGLSPNLGKKPHQIYQQKKATKEKKLTLPIPSKPSMKRNQQHIKHTIIQRWRTRRTHSHRNKTNQNKNKTSKQAKLQKIKKRYIFTLLGRNMLSFSCFLIVLALRDNLICLGKEFQKLGPDVFTPFDAKLVLFFLKL